MAATTPVSLAPAAAAADVPTAAVVPVAPIGLPAVTDSLASAGAGAESSEELDKQANARRRLELTEQQRTNWDQVLHLYQTKYGPGTRFAATLGMDNLRADLQPYRELYLMSCMLIDVFAQLGSYMPDIQAEALYRSLTLASKDLLIPFLNSIAGNRLGSRESLLTYCSKTERMHTVTASFLQTFTPMLQGNDDSKQAVSAAAVGAGA